MPFRKHDLYLLISNIECMHTLCPIPVTHLGAERDLFFIVTIGYVNTILNRLLLYLLSNGNGSNFKIGGKKVEIRLFWSKTFWVIFERVVLLLWIYARIYCHMFYLPDVLFIIQSVIVNNICVIISQWLMQDDVTAHTACSIPA